MHVDELIGGTEVEDHIVDIDARIDRFQTGVGDGVAVERNIAIVGIVVIEDAFREAATGNDELVTGIRAGVVFAIDGDRNRHHAIGMIDGKRVVAIAAVESQGVDRCGEYSIDLEGIAGHDDVRTVERDNELVVSRGTGQHRIACIHNSQDGVIVAVTALVSDLERIAADGKDAAFVEGVAHFV